MLPEYENGNYQRVRLIFTITTELISAVVLCDSIRTDLMFIEKCLFFQRLPQLYYQELWPAGLHALSLYKKNAKPEHNYTTIDY